MRTRVLLVDDHQEFRVLMEGLLNRYEDLRVVAQAGSLAEARDHAATCDVAILDLGLPDGQGTDLISDLHAANDGTAVLVMSNLIDPEIRARALDAGADEVLDKFAPLDQIVETVRRLGNP